MLFGGIIRVSCVFFIRKVCHVLGPPTVGGRLKCIDVIQWSTFGDFRKYCIALQFSDIKEYSYEILKKERRAQALYNGVRAIDMRLSQLKL